MEFQGKPVELLINNLENLPVDIKQTVINNGGGYYNHNLYWENIGPKTQKAPDDTLLSEINKNFVSFVDFQKLFTDSATKLFGSGWTWLTKSKEGNLKIINTPNQDSPLSSGLIPLLTLDIWEHAYYLKYQNRRAEYITKFWDVVNWEVVSTRLMTPPL